MKKNKRETIIELHEKGISRKEISLRVGSAVSYIASVINGSNENGRSKIMKSRAEIILLINRGYNVEEIIEKTGENKLFVYTTFRKFKATTNKRKTIANILERTSSFKEKEYNYEEIKNELEESKRIRTDFSDPLFIESIRRRWSRTCQIPSMEDLHNQSK